MKWHRTVYNYELLLLLLLQSHSDGICIGNGKHRLAIRGLACLWERKGDDLEEDQLQQITREGEDDAEYDLN